MYTFKTKNFVSELDFITTNKEKDGIKIREIAEYDLGNHILGLNLVSLRVYAIIYVWKYSTNSHTINYSHLFFIDNQLKY